MSALDDLFTCISNAISTSQPDRDIALNIFSLEESARAELAQLRATVAEARKIIERGATVYTGSANHNSAFNAMCKSWLAANPAP